MVTAEPTNVLRISAPETTQTYHVDLCELLTNVSAAARLPEFFTRRPTLLLRQSVRGSRQGLPDRSVRLLLLRSLQTREPNCRHSQGGGMLRSRRFCFGCHFLALVRNLPILKIW